MDELEIYCRHGLMPHPAGEEQAEHVTDPTGCPEIIKLGRFAGADTGVFFGCSEPPPTAVCNIFFIFKPTDVNFPLPVVFSLPN